MLKVLWLSELLFHYQYPRMTLLVIQGVRVVVVMPKFLTPHHADLFNVLWEGWACLSGHKAVAAAISTSPDISSLLQPAKA
jgi:hypothetical protein